MRIQISMVWFFCGVLAAADFHIYAPSPMTETLWVVKASEQGETLSLQVIEKAALGYAGRAIVAHSQQPCLYVAAGSVKEKEAHKGALIRLNADGRVAVVEHQPMVNGAGYLSLDRQNHFLLSTHYSDGEVSVYALDEKGQIGKRVAHEKMPHPFSHAILTSPDNAFVYIPFVKEHNALLQYRFDASTGSLTALTPHNAMPPAGTGPRHLVYHPTLPLVYFSNEQQVGVSVYRRADHGTLTLVQVCDALSAHEVKEGLSASDIVNTPDGKYIFTGIRGGNNDFDKVARYQLLDDGTLHLLGLTPTDKTPWGFTLSPDGHYLIVTAQQGGTLTVYRIGNDGTLTTAAAVTCDKGMVDVVCRPAP